MKCYNCTKPATGEHKVTELGNYTKGTKDKKVDLCKSCYDKVIEKRRIERQKLRSKSINGNPFTGEDYRKQVLDDFMNGIRI
jgi:hypothetical protein